MAPAFDKDRWAAISSHLDHALELDGGERAAWLASLRARDPTLAADLATLLEEHDVLADSGFLEGAPSVALPRPSLAGQAIGPYTLVSLVGQGGMGSVWLARRSDGRFEGVAAVKLLNAELVGRVGEERFAREGAILARLTHPHIAHLVDAGVSPLGQPYLVLEHVDGEPIDRYCDGRRLGTEARIRLFLDVLDAVAHAHASLIVHRDIKPSNVLVRTDGEVKLLDFGIAKLLEDGSLGGEATALTREGGRALTPEYAAPEQLTGGPITTAVDVYSLGTLLYLLLAGRHPAAPSLGSPARLLTAIVDADPPRPSDVADERNRRALRGDLDTIVARALKKKPEERYSSVTALADDLRRHLDHQPISARSDSLAYRAAKFVRRNRAPVALAGLAALALVAGVVATAAQARRATRQAALAEVQRRRADEEARAAAEQRDLALRQLSRAEAINDLNSFLLSDAAPSGKPFTAGELLARAERVVDREQGETAENRVEILVSIGRQYHGLDQYGRARQVLARAYDLAQKLPERSLRAKAACALASTIALSGEMERAEKLVGEALASLPPEPQFALERIYCLQRGAEVASDRGDPQTTLARTLESERLLEATPLASALLELHTTMSLAGAYQMAGRHREASTAWKRAAGRLVALGRDDTETASTLFNNWGLTLRSLGRTLDAERAFRRSVRISSADRGGREVPPMPLNNLARILCELRRLPEAAEYAERAYAAAGRAGNDVVVNQSLLVRAAVYRERGQLGPAAQMLAELEPRLRQALPAGHIAFASLASERGLLAAARGDVRRALAAADEALVVAERSPQGRAYLPLLLVRRSGAELRADRAEDARADAERALHLEREGAEPGTPSSGVGQACLGLSRALRALGRPDEAKASASSALGELEPTLGTDHPLTREARRLAAAGGRGP